MQTPWGFRTSYMELTLTGSIDSTEDTLSEGVRRPEVVDDGTDSAERRGGGVAVGDETVRAAKADEVAAEGGLKMDDCFRRGLEGAGLICTGLEGELDEEWEEETGVEMREGGRCDISGGNGGSVGCGEVRVEELNGVKVGR